MLRSIAILATALLALVSAPLAFAQTSFTEVTPTTGLWVTPESEDFWINAVAPADVDGDGDLDLAVFGFHVVYFGEVTHLLVLFRNQGAGGTGRWVFAEETVPITGLFAGSSDLAWGDYDNDGDQDLVVGSEGATKLFRNDGGTLVQMSVALPGYNEDSGYDGSYDLRSITWADADNDGDPDLLLPSVYDFSSNQYSTKLLRNDGSDGGTGWTFTDVAAAIDPTSNAQSAWADDDGDDDLDLFLVNVDPYTGEGFVKRFENTAGSFSGQPLLDITVEHGLADWGDYDGDGDMDILVAGNIQEPDETYVTVLRVYRNGAGTYVGTTLPAPVPAEPGAWWLDYYAATWADYDSDGDMDLLVTGAYVADEVRGGSEVYQNQGGTFVPLGLALQAPIGSVGRGGAFTWLDLDQDGDLDYLVAGAYYVPGGNGLVEAQIHLYRNGAPATNAAPTTPTGLSAVPNGSDVALAWAPATDDHTPAEALTYDLRIRRNGVPIGSGQRLPEPGSVSAVTDWKLRGLDGGSYTWEVRAVDAAFRGSALAQGSFTVQGPAGPPAVPDGSDGSAVRVQKNNKSGSTLTVTWDTVSCAGADDYHIVYGFKPGLPSSQGGTFSLAGSRCDAVSPYQWTNVPNPAPQPGRLLWFLVLASDGSGTEGSWGLDGHGLERVGPASGGSSGVCGITTKTVVNTCGQ